MKSGNVSGERNKVQVCDRVCIHVVLKVDRAQSVDGSASRLDKFYLCSVDAKLRDGSRDHHRNQLPKKIRCRTEVAHSKEHEKLGGNPEFDRFWATCSHFARTISFFEKVIFFSKLRRTNVLGFPVLEPGEVAQRYPSFIPIDGAKEALQNRVLDLFWCVSHKRKSWSEVEKPTFLKPRILRFFAVAPVYSSWA